METTIVISAIAFLAGMLANELIRYLEGVYGVLRVDHSNPEKDVYRLEIDNLEALAKKKFVVLKVDNNADLSQK